MGKGVTKLMELSLFIGGFLVLWYVTGEKVFRKKKKIVKDNILLILRHLCLEIYKVLNETSKTTKSVYDMIKNEPNTSIELNKLEEVLLNNGYKQRIEDVEKDVLNKFDVTVEDFYDELKNYEKDEDVQKVLNSIKKMYHESLLGIQPKLPSISENISQDVILNLTSLIYKKKRKIYKEKIDSMIKKNQDFNLNTTFSNSEFFNKLQKSTEHVEEQVIKENQDLVPNVFTFKYLINYYSDDINFVQRKKYLESKHGEKMIKILKVKKLKQKRKITKDNLSNKGFKTPPSQHSLIDQTDAAPPYLDMASSYHQVNELYVGQDQPIVQPIAPPEEHISDFVQSAQSIEVEEVQVQHKGAEKEDEEEEVSQEGPPLSAQMHGDHENEGQGSWISAQEGYEEEVHDEEVYDEQGYDEEVPDEQGYDEEVHDEEVYDEEFYDEQPHDEEVHDEEIHDEEFYDEQPHDEEEVHDEDAHDEDVHTEEAHEEEPHDEEFHTEEAHDEEVHDEEVHDEEFHTEEAHDEEVHDEEIHDEEPHDEEQYDAEDIVGYPDDGPKTDESSQMKEVDQEDTPFLDVQDEEEEEANASVMEQWMDPSAQEGANAESHVNDTEQDNQEVEKSATEEGGAVNEELAQEENEPTNEEADQEKGEDEPFPHQEDDGVSVEMVDALEEFSKEDLPAEEYSKEEPLAEHYSKEDSGGILERGASSRALLNGGRSSGGILERGAASRALLNGGRSSGGSAPRGATSQESQKRGTLAGQEIHIRETLEEKKELGKGFEERIKASSWEGYAGEKGMYLPIAPRALMITGGILNVLNLFQIVINLYIICSGVLLILCDVKTFNFYRHIEFLFTVVGRSLYMLIIASILINKGFFSLLIGITIIIISFLYVTLGYFNGIPIPLLDKNNQIGSFPDQKNNVRSTCSMETTDGFN
ncbi:hypothetical protein AK88_01570 [Plasmodium fragile]|uniref:Uncharacterized protein n=1 Tax=Plasmodium fragile TaxID=5857 RepID=A0A0D9QNS2_PLAFR|nr:uncharacterized protein AK88_01570 [Plasmodium fragile]KJP88689.1 hypothetical protein AK88_01570 [Plasmodium fragile]